jgi:hypothetical protein
MAMDNYFVDGEHTASQFAVNQFRFEVKGKIHEKVFFRFRNRYTKITDPTSTVDNISRTVDMAYIGVDLSPQTKLTVGKMIGDWGGYELLINPIDVLYYNTINSKSEFFLTGAALTHTLADKKNAFNFQLLNSRTRTLDEQFGTTLPTTITATKTPLTGVANWKGHLFNTKLETTYSYAYHIDAEDMGRNYFNLGNKLKLGKWVLYYDLEYSHEDLDQKAVVSGIIQSQQSVAAQNVTYVGNWIRTEYKVQPKMNLLLTLMNNNSYWNGNPDQNSQNKLLTSYGIIPSIEYIPFADLNLKFFAGYIATKYDYTSYAKSQYGVSNYSTGQFSIGIIAPLLVL